MLVLTDMADADSIPSLPEDEDNLEINSSVAQEKTPLLLKSSQSDHSYHNDNITIQTNEKTKDQLSDEYDVEISTIKSEIKPGKSSSFGAVFLVTNAAMGAGMLTFPYAFYLAGGWYYGMLTELVSTTSEIKLIWNNKVGVVNFVCEGKLIYSTNFLSVSYKEKTLLPENVN